MKSRLLTLFAALSLILCIATTILLARSYNSPEAITYLDCNADTSWPCPNVQSPVPTLPMNDARAITSIVSVQGKLWLSRLRLLRLNSPSINQTQPPFSSRIHWSRPASFGPPKITSNILSPTSRITSKTTLGFSTFDLQTAWYTKGLSQSGDAVRQRAFAFPTWWLILATALPPSL